MVMDAMITFQIVLLRRSNLVQVVQHRQVLQGSLPHLHPPKQGPSVLLTGISPTCTVVISRFIGATSV